MTSHERDEHESVDVTHNLGICSIISQNSSTFSPSFVLFHSVISNSEPWRSKTKRIGCNGSD